MYVGLHVKYRLFLPDVNETSTFSKDLRKILKHKNFMKIRPMGAELLGTKYSTCLHTVHNQNHEGTLFTPRSAVH